MNGFVAILKFERMISPTVLQLLFWAAIGGTVYGSWVLFGLDNRAWPIPLVLGPLVLRVVCERALIAFRSYNCLVEIRDQLSRRD